MEVEDGRKRAGCLLIIEHMAVICELAASILYGSTKIWIHLSLEYGMDGMSVLLCVVSVVKRDVWLVRSLWYNPILMVTQIKPAV
ncbi:hypothetical protein LPJ66_011668 [Kickxella alabastrina]|uniref:Uncharacterized protein n=1 Tax=Kickxella alabastrina TaxID=61397 RepID=A0ACC1I301_9FUNG|nr:hypothetical protein LPJ66_011668 [Kickxella alabastrina]